MVKKQLRHCAAIYIFIVMSQRVLVEVHLGNPTPTILDCADKVNLIMENPLT